MTDPTTLNIRILRSLSQDFDTARRQLERSWQHDGPLTLDSAAQQFTGLSSLLGRLSDQVRIGATVPWAPAPEERRAVVMFSGATVPTSRALRHFGEALVHLGLLHEHADGPVTPPLTEARGVTVKYHLHEVQDSLEETIRLLRTGAERLGDLPSRTAAARSRTTATAPHTVAPPATARTGTAPTPRRSL